MGKVIAWLIVVFVILFALRLLNIAKARSRAEAARRRAAEAQGKVSAPMVRCERCGVFVPKAEARVVASGYRCQDPACSGRR